MGLDEEHVLPGKVVWHVSGFGFGVSFLGPRTKGGPRTQDQKLGDPFYSHINCTGACCMRAVTADHSDRGPVGRIVLLRVLGYRVWSMGRRCLQCELTLLIVPSQLCMLCAMPLECHFLRLPCPPLLTNMTGDCEQLRALMFDVDSCMAQTMHLSHTALKILYP